MVWFASEILQEKYTLIFLNSKEKDTIITKFFEEEDIESINNLYRILTGTNRTEEEYRWEWIETWKGKGFSYLMYDNSRPSSDQLICQYSLIPTDFSYYGNIILAGKTENCMSHPDFRGKRIYFPHEKEYFEKAKMKFQAFFTTTGRGAPGKVRRKLGYTPLDVWVRYYFFLNRKEFISFRVKKAKTELVKKSVMVSKLALLITKILAQIDFLNMKKISVKNNPNYNIKEYNAQNISLDSIEKIWRANATQYGISVNRSTKYIDWRINKNPYHQHKYLVLEANNIPIGYLIYKHNALDNIFEIVDIIVENVNDKYFQLLINKIIDKAESVGALGIECQTLKSNRVLKHVFRKFSKSRRISKLIKDLTGNKRKEIHDFYSYISETIDQEKKGNNPQNWYVTALFLEK